MRQIIIEFSNRTLYTVVALLILATGLFIVNAYGGSQPTVVAHSVGEIDGLGSLATKNSVDWDAGEIVNIPVGFADGIDDVGGGISSLSK